MKIRSCHRQPGVLILLIQWPVLSGSLSVDLLPSSARSPPPQDIVAWLESSERSWVAVVDAGDGPRWLRALHARAAAAAILWRAPKRAVAASAPTWLQGAPAYVVAATRYKRLFGFLATDTSLAMKISVVGAEPVTADLQLNCAANTVLSIASSAYTRGRGTYSDSDNKKVFDVYWKKHGSFRAMLLREMKPGIWSKYYHDPLWKVVKEKDPNGPRLNVATTSVMIRLPSVALSPEFLSNGFGYRLSDLNGLPLNAVWSPGHEGDFNTDLRSMGRHDVSRGAELNLLREVLRSLHGDIALMRAQDTRPAEERILRNLFVGKTASLSTTRISLYSNTSSMLGAIMSSMEFSKVFIVVPRAEPLPAWSLPYRAFSAALWFLLAASAAAYAIAWRVVSGESWVQSLGIALSALSSYGGAAQERVSSTPGRLQLAGALLASAVVIVAIYQGRLFTITVHREYYSEIQTLKDLSKAGLPIVSPFAGTFHLFEEWTHDIATAHPELPKRLVSRSLNVSSELVLNSTEAYVIPESGWRRYKHWYPGAPDTHRRLPILYGMQATVLPIQRNCPWERPIEAQVLWARATGLYGLWKATALRDLALCLKANNRSHTRPPLAAPHAPRAFRLADLWPHFQLLAVGVAIAAAAFAAETVVI